MNFDYLLLKRNKIDYICTYYSVRKVSDLSFCENLVDFNEARMHETTVNLHTYA